MALSVAKPSLKVVGLHIEGLRALRKVDWPADGIGWGGTVPDMVMVGGVNGSGKTTLLEFIATAAQCLFIPTYRPVTPPAKRSRIDFRFTGQDVGDAVFSLVAHDEDVVEREKTSASDEKHEKLSALVSTLSSADAFTNSDLPGVVYLPTDRQLNIPGEAYKAAGSLNVPQEFFHRFSTPKRWQDSLEALLYSARWADLNAKEEGHPERATHFESYTKAFHAFFGGSKHLVWEGGELFVKIADTGARHSLMELSSGEKQALILAAELYRRWRPGSLILIDEPELHFHTSWQTTLWTMLERWQKERGGQVIVATQSTHLFRIAAPETTVLLGGPLA